MGIFSEYQIQYSNVANCTLMEKQLHSALLELKSAEAIISVLRENIKTVATPQQLIFSPQLHHVKPVNVKQVGTNKLV